MKIVCNTQLLNEACQNVQRVVSSKTSIPAMEGILMKAEDGMLSLTGYDLEVGIIRLRFVLRRELHISAKKEHTWKNREQRNDKGLGPADDRPHEKEGVRCQKRKERQAEQGNEPEFCRIHYE